MISRLMARAIDAVRVNVVSPAEFEGATGFLKRRRLGMSAIIVAGNHFLRASNSGIRMFPGAADWLRRERDCYCQLYPERKCAFVGSTTLFVEKLPGISLASLAEQGALTPAIMQAAARELRRAHALREASNRAWSHGDPHLKNILYDRDSDRCHLIDFETIHETTRSEHWRHADDLLVALLDLLGGKMGESSHEVARLFLDAYDHKEVRTALMQRLGTPKGLEGVLWLTRTHYVSPTLLTSRLAKLGP
jgi:hypothetical protein